MHRHLYALAAASFAFVSQPAAHPHVFVDGGVDFVVQDGSTLQTLEVTWLFDKFETLYLLSSSGVTLTVDGRLPSDAWEQLESDIGNWPDSFSGSTHLAVDERAILLGDPTGFDIRMVDARLELTFSRALVQPLKLSDKTLEAAFYEASYFYDFSVTQTPRILGSGASCKAKVIPFVADEEIQDIQATLAALGREQTPDQPNIGALFADRITLTCH